MRILLVSEVFAPAVSGVAVTTARFAAGLAERGHDVAVLTASQGAGLPRRARRDGYEVIRLSSIPNPFRRGFRFTVFVGGAVRRVVKEFQPDVIHIQDPVTICVAAAAEAKRRGIPLVATQHFLPEYLLEYLPKVAPLQRLVQAGLGRRLSRLYAGCACLTVPTETVRRAVGRLSVPVKVISNGVDTRRFSPAKQLPDTPTLLYLGRLDPEKNLPVLLEACAGLDVPCQLRIIGWGNLEPELRRYAESLGVAVEWLPALSPEGGALPEAYQQATIFCIPSLTETESMVTLEAMASGLPVLAANRGALPELVDEKNGCLLDPHDSGAWQSAIRRLVTDPALLKKMGAASRAKSLARSSVRSLDAMEALYASLV